MSQANASEKLSFWQKIGYGLGDIYGGGSGVVISFYYLIFLTDVVRIRPGLAGTVILISKIYDSIGVHSRAGLMLWSLERGMRRL